MPVYVSSHWIGFNILLKCMSCIFLTILILQILRYYLLLMYYKLFFLFDQILSYVYVVFFHYHQEKRMHIYETVTIPDGATRFKIQGLMTLTLVSITPRAYMKRDQARNWCVLQSAIQTFVMDLRLLEDQYYRYKHGWTYYVLL